MITIKNVVDAARSRKVTSYRDLAEAMGLEVKDGVYEFLSTLVPGLDDFIGCRRAAARASEAEASVRMIERARLGRKVFQLMMSYMKYPHFLMDVSTAMPAVSAVGDQSPPEPAPPDPPAIPASVPATVLPADPPKKPAPKPSGSDKPSKPSTPSKPKKADL